MTHVRYKVFCGASADELQEHLFPREVGIEEEGYTLKFKDSNGNLHDITSDRAVIEAAKILLVKSVDTIEAAKKTLLSQR